MFGTWSKKALDVTGGKPEVIYNSRTSGGVSCLTADLTLAQEKLGYQSFDQTGRWSAPYPSTRSKIQITQYSDPYWKLEASSINCLEYITI